MLPTHVLVGLALATPVAMNASATGGADLATPILLGAILGSVFPDLDVFADHRRTLHYPTIYPLCAVPSVALAVFVSTPVTVGLAAGIVAAALHCRMDRYGGSREFRPWERKSDRGVYDHVGGRWLRAKRWTRYDGSPRDLLVAGVAGIVPLTLLDGPVHTIALGALTVAVAYTAFRRPISRVADGVADAIRRAVTRVGDGFERR
ncbi:metal-dependent hydrolase [Halorubrum vacuolatum]|nr:metal-dependent hydrolase [Halorubrum vacuolatum]